MQVQGSILSAILAVIVILLVDCMLFGHSETNFFPLFTCVFMGTRSVYGFDVTTGTQSQDKYTSGKDVEIG